jgi:hypothetical protein
METRRLPSPPAAPFQVPLHEAEVPVWPQGTRKSAAILELDLGDPSPEESK